MTDAINPSHYKDIPPNTDIIGECIDYSERLGFTLGNAFKYVWRAGRKGDLEQDVNKALWYLDRFMLSEDKYPTQFVSLVYRKTYRDETVITPRAYALEMIACGTERSVQAAHIMLNRVLLGEDFHKKFDVRSIG